MSFLWQYLGAMMTEYKAGKMAASFTRVLGLTTYIAWITLTILEATGTGSVEVPGELTPVMLAFVGVKGLKDVAVALKGKSSYE